MDGKEFLNNEGIQRNVGFTRENFVRHYEDQKNFLSEGNKV